MTPLRVNGEHFELDVAPRRTLLDAPRADLGLTGTKKSCDMAVDGGNQLQRPRRNARFRDGGGERTMELADFFALPTAERRTASVLSPTSLPGVARRGGRARAARGAPRPRQVRSRRRGRRAGKRPCGIMGIRCR